MGNLFNIGVILENELSLFVVKEGLAKQKLIFKRKKSLEK